MTTTKRDEPVAIIEHTDAASEWATSEDRVPVFGVRRPGEPSPTVDEDSAPTLEVYTMPRKPNPGLALRFLKMARTQGDVATSWLIEEAVGEEGYEALCDELINYDGDPQKLLAEIVQKIQTIVMGGLDGGPKA